VIKPARYYLDTDFDSAHPHDLTDEHLVWRYSDFDATGIPDAQSMDSELTASDISSVAELINEKNSRRRTLYNGGTNQVELLVIVDPPQRRYYETVYSTSWYTQLYTDMADYVNSVSSKYQAVDFTAWSIGVISVSFVELEVIYEFSGNYASLYVPCTSYEQHWPCESDSNKCECTVKGTDYLDKLANYIVNYKDQSTFDNTQLITAYYFESAGGWGYLGAMCKEKTSCSNVVNTYGVTHLQNAAAHEMGHNFGASHDGEGNSCGSGEGLMGGASDGFSYCSLVSIQKYFSSNNGLTCLGDGVGSFSSNVDNDGGSTPDTNTNTDTNDNGGSSDYSCIGIASLDASWGVDYNGYYTYAGEKNSKPYYTKDGNYLFWHSSYSIWSVASSFDGVNAYCTAEQLSGCTGGAWKYGISGTGWLDDSDAYIYDCEDSSNSGNGDSCTYYSCVGLWYVEQSWSGGDLSGYYSPNGCMNGAAKYVSSAGNYIYRQSNGLWVVNTELSDSDTGFIHCSAGTDNVVDCANQWVYWSSTYSQWETDRDSWTWDCGGNGALNMDTDCENVGIYNDELCVRNGLGYNVTKWMLMDEVCENEMPVYYFVAEERNTTYYLHFEESKKYTDSDELYPKWIISVDELLSSEYAYCEDRDLLNCTHGKWYSLKEDDDFMQYGLVQSMRIFNNGECLEVDEVAEAGNGKKSMATTVAVVLVVLACLLIMIGGGLVIYGRFRKNMQTGQKQAKEVVPDDEEMVHSNEDELELDVDMIVTQTE